MRFSKPKVGIIGGTGSMGSWFADFLERLGIEVFRVGRKTDITPVEAARQCDIVVISVPIADTVGVIREIGPLVSEEKLLMDLTSIKKEPTQAMLEYSRAEVVGLHPLFGPDVTSGLSLRIAVCPGRGETGLNWLLKIFRDSKFGVTILSAEEHDRIMGLIQGVNHFSTIALALTISRSGLDLKDLENCSTQTFKHRLDRIRSILVQPEELFESLLIDNTHAGEYIDQYLQSVSELSKVTGRKDKKAFGDIFHMLRDVFMTRNAN